MRLRVDTEGGGEGAKPLSEAVMQKQEVELGFASYRDPYCYVRTYEQCFGKIRRFKIEVPGKEDEQGRANEGDEGE